MADFGILDTRLPQQAGNALQGSFMAAQQNQRQNALADMQMQQQQKQMADESSRQNALREYFKGGMTPDKINAIGQQSPNTALELQGIEKKKQMDAATMAEKISKADEGQRAKIKAMNDDIGKAAIWADTPEKWAQIVSHFQGTGANIEQFRDFNARPLMINQAKTIAQLLEESTPKPQAINMGGQTVIADMNTRTNPGIVGQKFQDTMTPGQAASNSIARQNLALEQEKFNNLKATGGAGGKVTEDQAKNRQLYQRTTQQLPIALQAFDSMGKLGNQVGNLTGASWLTSPEFQRGDAALKDIAASYLYSVSGATANPGEVANLMQTLRPRIGESEGAIADKKARIQQMVESINMRANPATAGQPAQTGNGASVPTATGPNGQKLYLRNGQWSPQ